MIKLIFLLLVSATTLISHGNQEDSCEMKEISRLQIKVAMENISNINIPLVEKPSQLPLELECINNNCHIVEQDKVIMKYIPDHSSADQRGYVYYPAINLLDQMGEIIEATKNYEVASSRCL